MCLCLHVDAWTSSFHDVVWWLALLSSRLFTRSGSNRELCALVGRGTALGTFEVARAFFAGKRMRSWPQALWLRSGLFPAMPAR